MGRDKMSPNAVCVDCKEPFRTYGCIRCEKCRVGKNGVKAGGRVGWHLCPVCGEPKSYAAKTCRECWKNKERAAQ